MTKRKLNFHGHYDTVHPPENGKAYFQDGAYFDGDGNFVETVDGRRNPEDQLEPQRLNLTDEGKDALADYSHKAPLHSPDGEAPLLISDEAAAELRKSFITDLQAKGIAIDDDGNPVDAKTSAPAAPAPTGGTPASGGTGDSEKTDWSTYDAKKALPAWLRGEIDPKPPFPVVRKWATEVFNQTFTTKDELINHAVEQNLVPAEKVKA